MMNTSIIISIVAVLIKVDVSSCREAGDVGPVSEFLMISRNSPHTRTAHHCGIINKRITTHNGKAFYQCDEGKTSIYSFEQMLSWLKEGILKIPNCNNTRYNAIQCCLVAQMGNFIDKCPGQHYACYKDGHKDIRQSIPTCEPPVIRNTRSINLQCQCYQSDYPVCGAEDLNDCNPFTNYSQCRHIEQRGDDTPYRCICNKTNEIPNKSSISDCSKLKATKTNERRQVELVQSPSSMKSTGSTDRYLLQYFHLTMVSLGLYLYWYVQTVD